MLGYLFAGQGSQYIGMGKDLCEAFPASKLIFERADKVLGFPLSGLCFQGPAEELKKTNNCQAAILTVTIAAWEAFKSSTRHQFSQLSYAAGLSLGEYSALVATEAINFEDAVYLVRRRGEFMEEEAARALGGMLSVIGLDLSTVREICAKTNTYVANINSHQQIVISGSKDGIERAKIAAKEKQAKRVITLEVSGAFHSPLMQPASLKLASELERIKIKKPKIPVISNFTGLEVDSPEDIKHNLIKQVASSVLWESSMRLILSKGVSSFIEFGPGKVLKGLMARIAPDSSVRNIEKKEDILALKEDQYAS